MKGRIVGLLLVVGLVLGGVGLVKQQKDNKVVKLGDFEIKRDMDKNINWMMIAGATLIASGIVVMVVPVGKK